MVTKRAAETTVDPASTFDIAEFLGGFKPFRPAVKLHRRGDLYEQIVSLAARIDAIEEARKADGGDEQSLADDDDLEPLIVEHNRILGEWEKDVHEFHFRAAEANDWRQARKMALADGLEPDEKGNFSDDDIIVYLWTLTTEDGIPLEGWRALMRDLGAAMMSEVVFGWLQVNNGGGGGLAPFSREPLPIPDRGKHSES